MSLFKRQHPPISTHLTSQGTLQVNWEKEYLGEFICPNCNLEQISQFYYQSSTISRLRLKCKSCHKETALTCQVPVHIYRYCPDIVCPNPLCTQIGLNGQKGWVYLRKRKTGACQCYFCGTTFDPKSTDLRSWVGSQAEVNTLPFCFEHDTWDLRNFYNLPNHRLLKFATIEPTWYRLQVKRYLHYLLNLRIYASDGRIQEKFTTLSQFGRIVKQHLIQQPADITREVVLSFSDACKNNKNATLHKKLSNLREFLEWLGLETAQLIRRRDIPKLTINDANWLDEPTRTAIKQHLTKIPTPIARHYLVQEYTAARPIDVCQIAFDCLVFENGKWYIKFYQHKVARWHKLLVTREIRLLIEEQQQWIRQTFGSNYSYLFCHFWNIRQSFYPSFPNIKPLPIPPKVGVKHNPMVRIVRLMIELENIRDANGIRPHFTGKITRSSRLQQVRVKYGIEAAQLYADHVSSATTFQYYAPPTREQVASVDLPFQELLMNRETRFLPWQSLPESLLKNPDAHELDIEILPRLVVYGHCALDPKTPCPYNLYPKCYGCGSFRPSTGKLPLYERQYAAEQKRMDSASEAGAELAYEEALATLEAMDIWLPDLRKEAEQ